MPPGWGGPPPNQPEWGGAVPPPPPPPFGGPGAHRPGLRPVGEFLSASFSLILRAIVPLLPLLIAVAVPVVVSFVAADAALGLTDWVDELGTRTADLQPGEDLVVPELDASTGEVVAWAIVLVTINLLGTVLVAIAGIVTLWAVHRGESPSTTEILALSARAFVPLLGLTVTALAVALGALAVIAVLVVAVAPVGVLTIVGLFPLSFWLFARFGLAPPIAAIEHRGASALRRSYQLTSGHGWGVLGRLLLFSLILSLATNVVGVPLQFVSFLGSAAVAVGTILTFLVSLASASVGLAGSIIVYADLVEAETPTRTGPLTTGWGQPL